ncbi:MAG: hypothetical protein FVQ77_12385 [Cytophagales bacterium]|nr:hypothetical protein [Cytophagales bacterium]
MRSKRFLLVVFISVLIVTVESCNSHQGDTQTYYDLYNELNNNTPKSSCTAHFIKDQCVRLVLILDSDERQHNLPNSIINIISLFDDLDEINIYGHLSKNPNFKNKISTLTIETGVDTLVISDSIEYSNSIKNLYIINHGVSLYILSLESSSIKNIGIGNAGIKDFSHFISVLPHLKFLNLMNNDIREVPDMGKVMDGLIIDLTNNKVDTQKVKMKNPEIHFIFNSTLLD